MVSLHVMPRLMNFGLQTPEIYAPQNSLKMTRVNYPATCLISVRCMPARPRLNTVRYGNCLSNAMPQFFNPLAH